MDKRSGISKSSGHVNHSAVEPSKNSEDQRETAENDLGLATNPTESPTQLPDDSKERKHLEGPVDLDAVFSERFPKRLQDQIDAIDLTKVVALATMDAKGVIFQVQGYLTWKQLAIIIPLVSTILIALKHLFGA